MLWDSRHIHNINNMINATYITCVCSEKEALLGLLQLGVRFLAGSNSWNGKLQNYEACSQLASNSVLAQLSVLFSVGLEPNFKYQLFYFQVYGNFVELSIAQCIKSYRKFVEEVCRIKGFRAILEIWATYPLHLSKIACSYICAQNWSQEQLKRNLLIQTFTTWKVLRIWNITTVNCPKRETTAECATWKLTPRISHIDLTGSRSTKGVVAFRQLPRKIGICKLVNIGQNVFKNF